MRFVQPLRLLLGRHRGCVGANRSFPSVGACGWCGQHACSLRAWLAANPTARAAPSKCSKGAGAAGLAAQLLPRRARLPGGEGVRWYRPLGTSGGPSDPSEMRAVFPFGKPAPARHVWTTVSNQRQPPSTSANRRQPPSTTVNHLQPPSKRPISHHQPHDHDKYGITTTFTRRVCARTHRVHGLPTRECHPCMNATRS